MRVLRTLSRQNDQGAKVAVAAKSVDEKQPSPSKRKKVEHAMTDVASSASVTRRRRVAKRTRKSRKNLFDKGIRTLL